MVPGFGEVNLILHLRGHIDTKIAKGYTFKVVYSIHCFSYTHFFIYFVFLTFLSDSRTEGQLRLHIDSRTDFKHTLSGVATI